MMGEVGKGITAFKKGVGDSTAKEIEDEEKGRRPDDARDVTPEKEKDKVERRVMLDLGWTELDGRRRRAL